jgi:excinuclease UvrABC nuclease subunit
MDFIETEASRLVEIFTTTPFLDCHPLTRDFQTVPARTGIYGLRHTDQELLYIGKASDIRKRFRGGHKALAWAFIDRLDPDAVRIISVVLGFQAWRQALEIEARMIQIVRPRYNSRIRQLE